VLSIARFGIGALTRVVILVATAVPVTIGMFQPLVLVMG
jgi:hypothetical protein